MRPNPYNILTLLGLCVSLAACGGTELDAELGDEHQLEYEAQAVGATRSIE
jgi:hypothetical protein